MRELRALQYGTSWSRLGRLVPPDESSFFGPDPIRTPLPEHVLYADADLYSITPSLIVLTIEFVFEEEHRSVFEESLRKYRQTYETPSERGGYYIHDPGTQKSDDIKEVRTNASRSIGDWIRKNIPGEFAAGVLQNENGFPTCEFVTLRRARPFPSQEERNDGFGYLIPLGMHSNFLVWESADVKGLRLDVMSRSSRLDYHSVLSVNEEDFANRYSRDGRGCDIESLIPMLHHKMSGIISVWAVVSLLEGYADHFKELRRSTLFGDLKGVRTEAVLEDISSTLYYSLDISAVTFDLSSSLERGAPTGFNIETFKPCKDCLGVEPETTLWRTFLNQIADYSKWLQGIDNSLLTQLTQYGGSLGVLENVRLQQRISSLTRVIVILTFVLAALALASVFNVNWSDLTEFIMRISRTLRP
ncbi:MAG: hypothetical protein F4X56_02175 [Gammaproteobacteria bacterium]|nr:hypothetical protein [Gammaproteobacteria bacterium]